MSYVILGRAVKTEYLTLGTLFGTATIAYAALRKDPSSTPRTMAKRVEAAVPIQASSNDEDEFIRTFVAEAEKEGRT